MRLLSKDELRKVGKLCCCCRSFRAKDRACNRANRLAPDDEVRDGNIVSMMWRLLWD